MDLICICIGSFLEAVVVQIWSKWSRIGTEYTNNSQIELNRPGTPCLGHLAYGALPRTPCQDTLPGPMDPCPWAPAGGGPSAGAHGPEPMAPGKISQVRSPKEGVLATCPRPK